MTFCKICGRVMPGKFDLEEIVLCKKCVEEFGSTADLNDPEEVEKLRRTMDDAIHNLSAGTRRN